MEDTKFSSEMVVSLEESMGDDLSIARNAWVSTQGQRASDEQDSQKVQGLINYLMKNRHGSPFEAVTFKFFIRAPLFVWREFHRHRVFSYNEESGRYTQLEPEFYMPSRERPIVQTGKPGHYTFIEGTKEQVDTVQGAIGSTSIQSYLAYQRLLDEGVAKEVARMVLPVNIFSSCYVTGNLRGFFNFLSLRTQHEDSAYPSYPQAEIRMVADQVETLIKEIVPLAWETFNENGRVCP